MNAAQTLIAALRSRHLGMHFDMAGINHQPFIIRFVNQNFQKFFLYTFLRQRMNR